MRLYVGKNGKKDAMVDETSLNTHILLTGLSGSGKSVRIADIIDHASKLGSTIIILDKDGTGYDIREANHISTLDDGLDVNILGKFETFSEEKRKQNIMKTAELLSSGRHFGARQQACLRKSIENAILNRYRFSNDMQAIEYFLQKEKSSVADSVLDGLWGILEGNIFRKGNGRSLKKGKVNIISFAGINHKLQVQVIEIMLSAIWNKYREQGYSGGNECLICIDEMQAISIKKESVLYEMLTEARKYGLSLLLATQTLSIFNSTEMSAVGQTAVKLFFRPQDNEMRKIARLIDPSNVVGIEKLLRNLKRGQALTVGNFEINGHHISTPLITKSECKLMEHEWGMLAN